MVWISSFEEMTNKLNKIFSAHLTRRRRRSIMAPNMVTYYKTEVISALEIYAAKSENGLKTSINPDIAKTIGGQLRLAEIIKSGLCSYCTAICSIMDLDNGVAYASKEGRTERNCKVY